MSLRRTGMFIGSVAYHLSKKRRHIAEKNAELIGVPDVEAVVRSSFRNNFATYVESFYSHRVDKAFFDSIEMEDMSGEKPVKGQGYFIVTAHMGCWELSSSVFTEKLDVHAAVIARRLNNEKLDDYIVKQRVNERVSYLHHRNIADKIPELLNEGTTIGALLDHSATLRDCMFVPFFGKNTTFIKGVPMIAVRKDIPLIPTFLLHTEKGFKMVVYPYIRPDKSLKPKERVHDLALRVNKVYEDVIRKYPDQWYLLHKRFKKIMEEDGNISESFYD